MILHLGVIDMPYTSYHGGKKAANPKRRKGAPAPKGKHSRAVTTAQVAGWLEDRYHIMEVFYEADGGVQSLLTESVNDAIENLLMGAPVGADPFLEGTSEIQRRFKQFISDGVMDKMGIPGVPTQAAIDGVNSRKNLRRGPIRPSFRDTGLYQSSFVAWVE